jgi:uncharacterized protein
MGQGSKPRMVACPQCGKATPWSDANGYRPFCSERCKTIDLGAWATESYRIPTAEPEPDQTEGKD